jgi:fumarate reductase subunit D
MDHYEYFDTLSQLGGGIWSSIFTSIAAVVTLWASRKATYGRLHGSMALHIISILVQIIATMIVFGSGIWELKRSMRRIKHDLYSDKYDSYSSDSYGRGYNYNANSGANYYNNNETVDSLENEQANIRKAERNELGQLSTYISKF